MKKVLVLVAAATIFGHFAFAEKVMEVGVKGGLLLNAGTKLADDNKDSEYSYSEKMTLGGDVGIFGHFGLVDLGPGTLSLQPEVFFSFGNGQKFEQKFEQKYEDEEYSEKTTYTNKYNSFDIVLLVGYDIPVGKLSIRPFLGPKVGIPIGKMKQDSSYSESYAGESYEEDSSQNIKMKGATIGMDFGCGIAVPLGKFVLGADIRYGIDFNKMKAECKYKDDDGNDKTDTIDILRRGALGINVTAGYRF